MLLFFFALMLSFKCWAVTTTASVIGQSSSVSQSASVLINPAFENDHFSYDFTFYFTKSLSKIEFDILSGPQPAAKQTVGLSAGLQFDNVNISVNGFSDSINDNNVISYGNAAKINFTSDYGYLGFQLSDTYLQQKSDYFALNQNIKNQMTLKQKKSSYQLGVFYFDPVFATLTYTKYTYDRNLESYLALLSLPNLILRNGAAFLSEFSTALDNSISLEGSYSFSQSFDIELSVGRTTDFFSPFIKSTDTRVGLVYYLASYNFGLGIQTVKSDDSNERNYSVDISANVQF